jgi:hypothetical protein
MVTRPEIYRGRESPLRVGGGVEPCEGRFRMLTAVVPGPEFALPVAPVFVLGVWAARTPAIVQPAISVRFTSPFPLFA